MSAPKTRFITIMGPTASGKTAVAAHLAFLLGGVVLSGDSRQVYRGMDIGTGKDLDDYMVNGLSVPYYLIDICDPGEKYNIHRFKQDFYKVYDALPEETPKIFCGGSGLYMESILGGYHLPEVPENPELRARLEELDMEELKEILESYGPLHNSTDLDTKKRAIRAIEIAEYRKLNPDSVGVAPRKPDKGPIYVLNVDREVRRQRITDRLADRLENGMVEEVQGLLDKGVSPEDLIYYGLEYKYITEYLLGQYDFEEMKRRLEIAIHQFGKRQMTWLRGMERRGFKLTYIEPQETPQLTALALLRKLP